MQPTAHAGAHAADYYQVDDLKTYCYMDILVCVHK